MTLQPARRSTKVLYLLALVVATLPFLSSGWVSLTTGRSWAGLLGITSLLIVVAICRAVTLLRNAALLDAPTATGLSRWVRFAGIWLMGLGVLVAVAQVAAVPITRALFPRPTENGVEFFVVGMWFALLWGGAPTGLLVFEFSRLLSFEHHAREVRPQTNITKSR